MTNLAARNKKMKGVALKSLLESFPKLLSISIPEDVNEVFVGLPDAVSKQEMVSDGSPEAEEDAELGCSVTVGGHVIQSVLQRLPYLTRWAGTCSSGELDADMLRSKLLGYLSRVNVYQQ